jgi:hypothetical protein
MGLPRRLCDDIAGLMGGNPEGLRFRQLDWPMVNNSAIDQSADAAREVVTQKFSQMPAKVIVIGESLGDYFGPVADLQPWLPARAGRQEILLVPSVRALMDSAAQKRQLLMALKGWP